jgi:hypothetical protein
MATMKDARDLARVEWNANLSVSDTAAYKGKITPYPDRH